MHPSMRLEYGPKSGAILGELFLATSLKKITDDKRQGGVFFIGFGYIM